MAEAFALGGVQRLALFDLDNTLVDLDAAFAVRAAEFAGVHGLGQQAVDWLVALNRQGYPHREVFFAKVREHFTLPEPVEELWGRYRRRMPYLVRCRPEVLEGLARLRADGWKVGIVTNGTGGQPARQTSADRPGLGGRRLCAVGGGGGAQAGCGVV